MGTCYRIDFFCLCANDTDCSSGEKCIYGLCKVPPPTTGITTVYTVKPYCDTDSDCLQGSTCEDGQCVENEGKLSESEIQIIGVTVFAAVAVFFGILFAGFLYLVMILKRKQAGLRRKILKYNYRYIE